MAHPVVHFDYDFSIYGRKIRLMFAGLGTTFQRTVVPMVLPRPTLEKMGITYRRIPVTAIGKDVYADTSLIMDVLQTMFTKLPTTPADKAYQAFGNNLFRTSAMALLPTERLNEDFKKDRLTIFPMIAHPEYASRRASGIADVKGLFRTIEDDFLSAGPFIAGPKFGVADVHIGFAVQYIMLQLHLDQEPTFEAHTFPKLIKWLHSFPEPSFNEVPAEQGIETVLGAEYSATPIGVAPNDPLGLSEGTLVNVESADAQMGAHPQLGKLFGANEQEVVIELETGVRMHFPRTGYLVRKA